MRELTLLSAGAHCLNAFVLFVVSFFKPAPPSREKFVLAVPKLPSANGVQNALQAVADAIVEFEKLRMKALKQVQRMLVQQQDVNEKKYIADAIEARFRHNEMQREQTQQINADAKRKKSKLVNQAAMAQMKYEEELDAQYDQPPANNNAHAYANAHASVRLHKQHSRARTLAIHRAHLCLSLRKLA